MDWLSLKSEASRLLLEKDALHIYAALLIQLVAARLSGHSFGHRFPWLVVLAAELVNEAIDLWRGLEPVLRPWQVVEGVHDIVNTMTLPTILLLLTRHASSLFDWPERPVRDSGETAAAVPAARGDDQRDVSPSQA